MRILLQILLVVITVFPVYAIDIWEDNAEIFDHFYNYRFDETIAILKEKMHASDYPYPYYTFYSYANIRSQLANAEYDSLDIKANKTIRRFRPFFEDYLREHPEDVHAQFYYTALLGGKMRIYLQEMDYIAILKEGPKILSNKISIDYYSDEPYVDMDFGTGSFDYYASVVVRNAGFKGILVRPQSNGIDDLRDAYLHGKYTRWEAAIALMYIYLYDKSDHKECEKLYVNFLNNYPDNLEVLAIAAENAFYLNRRAEGNRRIRHIERFLDSGVLHNDTGWRSRLIYLKGIRAMLKNDHAEALNYFNEVYEKDAIEYSWYRAIIPKYIADVYMDMGLTRSARLYYEKSIESNEVIPHVRDAKDSLKKIIR